MKKYSWDVDTERTESDKRYAVNDKIDIWNIDIGCVIIFFTAYGSPLTVLYVQDRSFHQIAILKKQKLISYHAIWKATNKKAPSIL